MTSSAIAIATGEHDFDFLHGNWTVHNRKRAPLTSSDDWHEFEATAVERPLWGGLANIEETPLTEEVGFARLHEYLAKIPAASLDAVVTIRNYHDLKNPAEVLPELKRVLKPGGVLGVVDSRTTSGRDLPTHRIADDVIIREATAAGSTLAGASQLLSNPKDDYTKTFWEARFIVDQSCLKFTR